MPTTMTWPLSTGPVGEVALANMALGLIGANYILSSSLPATDGTPEANYVNSFFAPIRRAVLEDRDWTFATTKTELTALEDSDPDFPELPPTWGYAYLVPDDCIRVVKLFNGITPSFSGTSDDPEGPELSVMYERLGKWVFCNESTVWMKYVYDEDDTTLWSSNFVFTMAARLAAELAIPITNNVQLFQAMMGKYQLSIKDAAAGDGRQGTSQKIKSPSRLRMARLRMVA